MARFGRRHPWQRSLERRASKRTAAEVKAQEALYAAPAEAAKPKTRKLGGG